MKPLNKEKRFSLEPPVSVDSSSSQISLSSCNPSLITANVEFCSKANDLLINKSLNVLVL